MFFSAVVLLLRAALVAPMPVAFALYDGMIKSGHRSGADFFLNFLCTSLILPRALRGFDFWPPVSQLLIHLWHCFYSTAKSNFDDKEVDLSSGRVFLCWADPCSAIVLCVRLHEMSALFWYVKELNDVGNKNTT